MGAYAHAGFFWGIQLASRTLEGLKNRVGMALWCPKCHMRWKAGGVEFCSKDGAKLEPFSGFLPEDTLYGEPPVGKAYGCELVRYGLEDFESVFAVVTESAHRLCSEGVEVEILQPTALSVGRNWQLALTQFIKGLGIVVDAYPQWHLVCSHY